MAGARLGATPAECSSSLARWGKPEQEAEEEEGFGRNSRSPSAPVLKRGGERLQVPL